MEILSIIERGGVAVVDSRDVAEYVGKQHNDLLKDIRRYAEFLGVGAFPLTDFFIESTYVSEQNKTLPNYLITRKGCEFVANKLTGAKGALFTAAYIERFHQYEDALTVALPKDYPSALRALADSYEKQKALEMQALLDAPKVEFYDAVTQSTTTIGIGEVAKVLNMGLGRNGLFSLLRRKGVLAGNNIPYQEYVNRGWFKCAEKKYDTPYGETRINVKTTVYQKGVDGIRRILLDEGYSQQGSLIPQADD